MATRKNAGAREDDLRLAIHRIMQGRAETKTIKLNIASVAREAGVTPALIHNRYPDIADTIRLARTRDNRTQRDRRLQELLEGRARLERLGDELSSLCKDFVRLSALNEALMLENWTLRVKLNDARWSSLDGPEPD